MDQSRTSEDFRRRQAGMKIAGTVRYNGKTIQLTEDTIDQIVYQQKGEIIQMLLTTYIDDKPITFREDQVEYLKIAHIQSTESTLEYEKEE